MTIERNYPVLFADSAGVFQIASPGETQRSAFKVSVRKHVRQTKGVVILFCVSEYIFKSV